MTARERLDGLVTVDRVTSLPGGDLTLVVLVMALLYVGVALLGLVLGLDLNGLFNSLQTITFFAAVYALLALALNIQWGYAGLFNVGVVGFMAVGVYTMTMLTRPPNPVSGTPGLGLPLAVGVLGGTVAAALVGLLAAVPALRVNDDYFAIITVGLAEIIRIFVSSPTFERISVGGIAVGTGGASGIGLPRNPVGALYYVDPAAPASGTTPLGDVVFGIFGSLSIDEAIVVDATYTGVLVAVVVLYYVLVERIAKSPFGRTLKAIREDELVANALGKNTDSFKIKTFMLGCALMGLGGILWQGSQGFTSPGNYLPQQTFYIFIALIIGGAGSNTGSVIGGALFAGLLFQGPPIIGRLVEQLVDFGATPNTVVEAVAPLASLDVVPLLAYSISNIAYLRFILVGVVLIYFIQNRPQGLLGHRKETAASVDLGRPPADGRGGDHERES